MNSIITGDGQLGQGCVSASRATLGMESHHSSLCRMKAMLDAGTIHALPYSHSTGCHMRTTEERQANPELPKSDIRRCMIR